MGTADGTIVDAKVLSGNMSDKTYNKDNIDDVVKLLDQLDVDKTTFASEGPRYLTVRMCQVVKYSGWESHRVR